ncbi:MAG: AAA family ATPase [Anaerolineae bacterium]|nr:AAA family ATPase [Anaerolineae bacterium]
MVVPVENGFKAVSQRNSLERLPTGVVGLDEVLCGGLVAKRAYLLHGNPGSGKTTLGLHFLMTGAKRGDQALYITMGETEQQIRQNGEEVGFDLTGIKFLDLAPSPDFFAQLQSYDIFSPADVERDPTTERITSEVEKLKPIRVFIDAMTHFRYLSSDDLQFRRQTHSFLRFLTDSGATVLFTSEYSAQQPDDDLQYMSDGIIRLDHEHDTRTISVTKFRGSDFISGQHSLRLGNNGMEVFPRLVPTIEVKQEFTTGILSSGIAEFDELVHGGIERGTVTILTGPTGVGKTTLGMQFMKEAAGRGERSVIYTFEEWSDALIRRSANINIPVASMVERGTLAVVQIEPLRYSPDEFARMVRKDVEENGASIVMIDSISGYRLSVRGEDLLRHIHALAKYLQSKNVAVILINEVDDIVGTFKATEIAASYMADNIIFLRYLEIRGELRRAVGVLKKRHSDFQKTMREYEITRYGIKVGKPLTEMRGILFGVPEIKE